LAWAVHARDYDARMDYGLVLPSLGDGANRDGIIAAVDVAAEHGFTDVWATDHILIDHAGAEDYGRIYEAITTLAWIAGRSREIRLGASVIVVPMRNAVVLAKQLATLDALSEGRLIAGFGVGWSEAEFTNVGVGDRFHERGAYAEETIALCRHLWSGSREPFQGRFHQFEDFHFQPLPAQGAGIPIWLGGRDERALRRAGRLADAYHASAASPTALAQRIPIVREAAAAAGRPMPRLSGRARVELNSGPESFYTMHGSPAAVASEIRSFAALGVDHLALAFPPRDAVGLRAAVGRFMREVVPLV
jgi:probable F420-dependent oxidoreductase